MGIIPGRVTYIIDKKGIVRHIFDSQTQAQKHVEEAKKTLMEIEKEEKATSLSGEELCLNYTIR